MRVFILNGAKDWSTSHGRLNSSLCDEAIRLLKSRGIEVESLTIDDGYDITTEIDKYLWADVVIYQFPTWWMGPPWHVKRYFDEVLNEGYGKLWDSDPDEPYGSGGHLRGKKYLVSMTWSATEDVFTDPDKFFEGKGVDYVLAPFHKTHEFMGMKALPTFMVNDVVFHPNVPKAIARLKEHLVTVLNL